MGFKAFASKVITFFASQCGAVAGETLPNSLPGNVTTMSLKAPVGVVGGIIPWNGPLGSQWWILGAVLASGCTAVHQAGRRCFAVGPAHGRAAARSRAAGRRDQCRHRATAPRPAQRWPRHPDVDRIAFTGSTVTGRKIIEASAGNIKKLQLELGGKSPDIVFADADLDKAVPGAAMGVFNNTGQICYAGTRVFVQRPHRQGILPPGWLSSPRRSASATASIPTRSSAR